MKKPTKNLFSNSVIWKYGVHSGMRCEKFGYWIAPDVEPYYTVIDDTTYGIASCYYHPDSEPFGKVMLNYVFTVDGVIIMGDKIDPSLIALFEHASSSYKSRVDKEEVRKKIFARVFLSDQLRDAGRGI